jgi:hypothetical protein
MRKLKFLKTHSKYDKRGYTITTHGFLHFLAQLICSIKDMKNWMDYSIPPIVFLTETHVRIADTIVVCELNVLSVLK